MLNHSTNIHKHAIFKHIYMYMYIHTCMYIYIYPGTHIYIHTYIHACIGQYITSLHIITYTHACAYLPIRDVIASFSIEDFLSTNEDAMKIGAHEVALASVDTIV